MKEQILQAIEAYGVAVKSNNSILLRLSAEHVTSLVNGLELVPPSSPDPQPEALTTPENGNNP